MVNLIQISFVLLFALEGHVALLAMIMTTKQLLYVIFFIKNISRDLINVLLINLYKINPSISAQQAGLFSDMVRLTKDLSSCTLCPASGSGLN